MNTINYIDIIIVVFYFVVLITIGIYTSRGNEDNSLAYFFSNKKTNWFLLGTSLFVTAVSAIYLYVLFNMKSSSGIVVILIGIVSAFSLILLGWFFAPIYLKSRISTLPEFLGKKFNNSVKISFTLLSVLFYVFFQMFLILFIGGALLRAALGFDYLTSIMILIIITGFYLIIGGSKALSYTHLLQAILIFIGVLSLTLFNTNSIGGLEELLERSPIEYFSISSLLSSTDISLVGIILGSLIVGVWYFCTDQYIVQRVFCSDKEDHIKKATVLSGLLHIVLSILIVFFGMTLFVLYPDNENSNLLAVYLNNSFLPYGLKGIAIVTILSILMSSLASLLNSISTLITLELFESPVFEMSERKTVLFGRLSIMAIVVFTILMIPLIRSLSFELVGKLFYLLAYTAPTVLAIFLVSIFNTKIKGNIILIAISIGVLIGVIRGLTDFGIITLIENGNFLYSFFELKILDFCIFLFVFQIVTINVIGVFVSESGASILKSKYQFILSKINANSSTGKN